MNPPPFPTSAFDERAFIEKYPKPYLQREVIELFGDELPSLIRKLRITLDNENQRAAQIVSEMIEDVVGVFAANSSLDSARQISLAIHESDFESAKEQFTPFVHELVQLRGDLRRYARQLLVADPNDATLNEAA